MRMNWKLRSFILRRLAGTPGGYSAYQFLQRRVGLHVQPEFLVKKIDAQAKMARELLSHGRAIEGARVMEVGTGWVPIVPVAFWFCGADRVDTFDLNRHLLPDVFSKILAAIAYRLDELLEIWGDLVPQGRLGEKIRILERYGHDEAAFRDAARIQYHAPADASRTALRSGSVDIHYSLDTLEHVPREEVRRILEEASRVLADDGFTVHLVDPTDHFAHYDSSISSVNFLSMDENEYRRHFSNRLAYQNRLHDSDLQSLFRETGFRIAHRSGRTDLRALRLLRSGFPLAEQFAHRSHEELSRESLMYVAARSHGLDPDSDTPGR